MLRAEDTNRRKRIGELLVHEGVISAVQLREGLAVQEERGGKLVEILISLGHMESRDFLTFLARQGGVPSIDLAYYEIDKDLLRLLPAPFARDHEVVPLDRIGHSLTVGMVCPLDVGTLNEISTMTGLKVKALLCSAKDIRATLDRYYRSDEEEPSVPEGDLEGLEAPLRLSSVVSLLQQLESLPAMPGTVQRVRQLMDSPDSAASDVANAIRQDPAVSAKVLRLANSAAYGFIQQVKDVNLAVSLLGPQEVYSIVLSTAVADILSEATDFDYEDFWRDSVHCATAAKRITQQTGRKGMDGVFVAGLLHDIGRPGLAQVVPAHYSRIRPDIYEDELVEMEEAILGITHAEAGYEMACNWEFPAEIAEAIRFHHNPDQVTSAQEYVDVVAVAAAMAIARHAGGEDPPRPDLGKCASALKRLGLSTEQAEAIFESLPAQSEFDSLWR